MRSIIRLRRDRLVRTSLNPTHRSAFTLVELLVVIAIIGLLVGLLAPAAMRAVGSANKAAILTEIQQYDSAIKDFKNEVGAFPPNAQTDAAGTANKHINNSTVLSNFKRYFKKAFPSHREPSYLVEAIVGNSHSTASGTTLPSGPLAGGMNGAESLIFWLSGFSDDPKYPISGVGGPSYSIPSAGGSNNRTFDRINDRSWRLDVRLDNLGPRAEDDYFDQTDNRYIEYQDPQDPARLRRINFWYLKGNRTPAPFVYFDASRGSSAEAQNDPPAAVLLGSSLQFQGADADALNELFYVHAIKRVKSDASAANPLEFANDGTFQILHPGIDEAWGIMPMVSPSNSGDLIDSDQYHDNGSNTVLGLVFPDGPWTGDLADTLTNFSDSTLEDAQP